jgi:hypothetical protein
MPHAVFGQIVDPNRPPPAPTPTPTPPPSTPIDIDVLTLDSIVPLPNWTDPQTRIGPLRITFGKHTEWTYNSFDRKIYSFGGDGTYPPFFNASNSMRFHRLTPQGAFDNFYPYWGKPGRPFPVGEDSCPFVFDSSRKCYWVWGGYYGPSEDARNVGVAKRYGIWRFWLTGALAGEWEEVVPYSGSGAPAPPPNAPQGQGGIYYPRRDYLIWVGGSRLYWYHCASGQTGNVPITVSGDNSFQMAYDPKNEELFWSECLRHGSVFATKLSSLPASAPTRTLLTGLYRYKAGQVPPNGQVPLMFRSSSRKLYMFAQPAGQTITSSGTPVGPENKTGIFEIDVDTLEVRTYSYPRQLAVASANFPRGRRFNCAEYCDLEDRILATATDGDSVFILKWSPPSWTPAAGDVRAITKDADGRPVNTIDTVKPYPSGANPVYRGFIGVSAVTKAWASAAFAREFSTNGAMLCHNGGDADYWGNEVYAFDFDTRRWERLSDPTQAMSGNISTDVSRNPADPLHFNRVECEHGPAVAEYGFGPLPVGTQPGVPHVYDGMLWIPGSYVGNQRGALLRPHSTFVYATRSTGRAHYFDLDTRKWGRFSVNRGGQAPLISARVPIIGHDERLQRIYHSYGYLDLQTKMQVNRAWTNLSDNTSGVFDNARRLWLMPRMNLSTDVGSMAPGTLRAIAVDGTSTSVELSMAGTVWPRGYAFHAGLLYCPDLDCYFLYSQGTASTPLNPQQMYKIQPPSSNPLTNPWTVALITMGGDAVVADPQPIGNYKRFMWIPALKCIAILNKWDSYVYIYKPVGV